MAEPIDFFALGRGSAPPPTPLPPLVTPAAPAQPADVTALAGEWLRVRREVELAMDRGIIPGGGYVYDPRLDILRTRVQERWATLATPETTAECLVLIRKMHENLSAAIFGYAFLRAALLLHGDSVQAEHVADFEIAFLKRAEIDPAKAHTDAQQPQAQAVADDEDDEDDL